jgi:predicted DNA-binding transcriptional regulator AlpA
MNAVAEVEEDVLLTTLQAARRIAFSPATLATWRCVKGEDEQPIPYVRLGRSIRYRRSDVQKFVEQERSK